MRRLAAWFLLTLASTLVVAAPGRGKREKQPEPDRPAVRLSASVRHGYAPLQVTLSAHLTGVSPTDAAYCHAGIEWEARSPGGVITSSREEPRCLHPPETVHIEGTYTRVVTLGAGTYAYRVILHTKDGGQLASTAVDINVLPR